MYVPSMHPTLCPWQWVATVEHNHKNAPFQTQLLLQKGVRGFWAISINERAHVTKPSNESVRSLGPWTMPHVTESSLFMLNTPNGTHAKKRKGGGGSQYQEKDKEEESRKEQCLQGTEMGLVFILAIYFDTLFLAVRRLFFLFKPLWPTGEKNPFHSIPIHPCVSFWSPIS